MKLEFYEQIFENTQNIKIYDDPSSGRRVFACRQTDGHDEANRSFSQFWNAPKRSVPTAQGTYHHTDQLTNGKVIQKRLLYIFLLA